ncbi:TetR family transcriptional regulator [Actinomadura parmotrematis]|uniref:TetR family transcriptional regulator n=1 Tax=Actinomadura parmotrematis TaxID=2864039 RepID=A0ABS7FXI2_9ACTN|nr:TetR family transcriptional regulator [Actinomadura parmotrematis]MBW8484389.1 TetR family transcriptional regulator [Actinomadura parmotrematis]
MTEVLPAGRRERKKQRTREALVDAAFALFAEKGFDATTVEEIADAVDVSSRTFFRYFASKEDVALTFQEEQLRVVHEAFAARPADEPVITALRRAMVSTVRACEHGELGFDAGRFTCMIELTERSDALMAGSLEHAQRKQAEITAAVAARLGADPATDIRPHVITTTVMSAFHAAAEYVRSTGAGLSLSDALDEAFAVLEGGLNLPSAPPPAG